MIIQYSTLFICVFCSEVLIPNYFIIFMHLDSVYITEGEVDKPGKIDNFVDISDDVVKHGITLLKH